MLVQGVLNLIAGLFRLLLLPLRLAQMPQSVSDVVQDVIGYLIQGVAILQAYTHFSFLFLLFSFCLAVEALYLGYHFVLWVLRKIPFFGID